jgi:hypothetical protein
VAAEIHAVLNDRDGLPLTRRADDEASLICEVCRYFVGGRTFIPSWASQATGQG